MGICAFVASGLNFDVDGYLKNCPFEAKSIFRKGEIPPKKNPDNLSRTDSGFVALVDSKEGSDLSAQIHAALNFLIENEKELVRLKSQGADNMLLDFGIELGDEIQRSEYLPPSLLAALARFGMGMMFSAIRIPRG